MPGKYCFNNQFYDRDDDLYSNFGKLGLELQVMLCVTVTFYCHLRADLVRSTNICPLSGIDIWLNIVSSRY